MVKMNGIAHGLKPLLAVLFAGICTVAANAGSYSLDLRDRGAKASAFRTAGATSQTAESGLVRETRLPAGAATVGRIASGDELTVCLFDGVSVVLEIGKKLEGALGGRSFSAKVRGYAGVHNALVVESDEGLQVDIRDYKAGRVYTVASGRDGVLVREIDPSKVKVTPSAPLKPLRRGKENVTRPKAARSAAEDSGRVSIDILVAYDAGAKTWANGNGGGVTNFATVAVQKMNVALGNTGLDVYFRFRLVGIETVSETTTDLNRALNAATDGESGWDAIQAKRDEVGADMVTVLIDTGSDSGVTGLGWSLERDVDVADFSEVAYNCCAIRSVAGSHTMTHECGHNLGAGHSDIQTTQPGPQRDSYSAGYYFRANGTDYHTIMAYGSDGRTATYYAEVPYFSSPDYAYEGVAVGDETHDNTRTLRQTCVGAAQWRDQVVPQEGDDPEGPAELVWNTTKAEAFAAATAAGKRILLVYGRDTCGNTTATRDYTCEDPEVKAKLLAGYVLWYSNCDTQWSESSGYLLNFEGTLPGVSVIDPELDRVIVGTGGYLNVSGMLALLAGAEGWEPPEPPETLAEARIEAFETGKLLFVLSGADWCPYTAIVKDYITSLGTAFTDDFVLYYCDVDTDTTGMADGIPSYGVFDPVEFAGNWSDGLLAYNSGGVDERVQKVLDDALDAYAQRTPPVGTQYLITYDLQGGYWEDAYWHRETFGIPVSYTLTGLPLELPVPRRAGYMFEGWKMDGQVINVMPRGTSGHVLLTATWRPATADDYVWSYVIENGEAIIYAESGYDLVVSPPPAGDVVVPSELGGCPVTELRGWVFYNQFDSVTSVTIPATIRKIDEMAFCNFCGQSINVAEDNAWYSSDDGVLYDKNKTVLLRCPTGKTSVSIPSSVVEIGICGLSDCYFLNEILLPSGLKKIGDSAFYQCSGLTNMSLPEGLLSIGYNAFVIYYSDLTLTIPSSVVEIGDDAFGSNNNMSIEVAAGNERYATVDGMLYDNFEKRLMWCPRYKRSAVVPEGTLAIDGDAFGFCMVTNVSLPKSLAEIRDGAFYCSCIESIEIPSSVVCLGNAFGGCSLLHDVYFNGDSPLRGDSYCMFCATPESLTCHVREGSVGWKEPGSAELPDAWPVGDEYARRIVHWEGQPPLEHYSVAYDLGGGYVYYENPIAAIPGVALCVHAPVSGPYGYAFAGWTVTGGLNDLTAKWGTSPDAMVGIGGSDALCVNGEAGDVYFLDLANAGGRVTLTANWKSVDDSDPDDNDPEPGALTWYTTKKEAFSVAKAAGKRILLVYGRDTCGNTTATRNSTCEDAEVKAKLLAGYVLWYSNCDTQSSESGKYLMNFEGILPGVSVIDPALDKAIAGVGGYQDKAAMLALLEEAENSVPPEPPVDPEPPEGTYTVTFNANGGKGEMPDQVFTNGVEHALATNCFTCVDKLFDGWATNDTGEAVYDDGEKVRDLASAGGKVVLFATWKDDPNAKKNPLIDDPKLKDDEPVETPVGALSYTGYVTDGEEIVGLVTVKVTKKGAVTATVQLPEGTKLAKTSYKGNLGEGGKAELACSKNGGKISALVCEGLASGTIEVGKEKLGFTARSSAKEVLVDLDALNGKVWTVALKSAPAKKLPELMNGYSVLSVVAGKKGKMKVSGVLADGTKVSVTAQGMAFGDSVVVPVVFVKKTTAFSLKLLVKASGVQVGNVSDWTAAGGTATWEKAIASAPDNVKAGAKFALGMDVKDIIETFGAVDAAKGKKSILPNGVPVKAVDASSGKWTLPKAGKVAFVKGSTEELDESKFTAKNETDPNPAALKLTFKKKTGLFSGTFQFYQLSAGKLKKLKAAVNGAVVGGKGYGSGVVKNVGALPVTVR